MYIRLSRSGPRSRIEIWPIQQNYDTWYRTYTWLWLTTFIRNTSVTPVEISTRNRYIFRPLNISMKSIRYSFKVSAALLLFYLIFLITCRYSPMLLNINLNVSHTIPKKNSFAFHFPHRRLVIQTQCFGCRLCFRLQVREINLIGGLLRMSSSQLLGAVA